MQLPPHLISSAVVVAVVCCLSQLTCWAQHCGSQGGGRAATCLNSLCCSQYGYCGSTTAYCGGGCQSGPCIAAHGSSSRQAPTRHRGHHRYKPKSQVAALISRSNFNQFLSQSYSSSCPSNGFYTYRTFLSCATSYSGFGTIGSSVVQKQELAAFFANVAHETGSGCYVEEIVKDIYCDPSLAPCARGQEYYGRGPIQLSWNYNYQAAGKTLGFDGINDPGIVARNATIAFETAVWYWMTQGSPSCHAAIVGGLGFGATINAINGGLECGASANQAEQKHRITLYKSFCSILHVHPGKNLTC